MLGLAQKLTDKYWAGAITIAAIGLALKFALIAAEAFPFNSDEAVVALMARHILDGEWPVFFYGQAYMGSLDASLIAIGFALLGQSVWVIRLIQSLLYFWTILTTASLAWSIFRNKWIAWTAAALLAVPAVNVLLYTTVSLGGYGEALLIGNLLMLLAILVWREGRGFALWGLLAGFGFWAFGLTLVYTIPTGILVVRKLWPSIVKLFAASATFLIGALPWIAEGLNRGFGSFLRELFGEAISGSSSGGLVSVWEHTVNFVLFGPTVAFGIRAPWSVELIVPLLAPAILLIWGGVLIYGVARLKERDAAKTGRWMLAGVAMTLIAGFLITPFGADPSGRYFVPLAIPLSLMAGEFFVGLVVPRFGKLAVAALGLLLVFNLWGSLQAAHEKPPGITTQFDPVAQVNHAYLPELIEFLAEHEEWSGYTNYWVAYPLAFHSEERIIFTPRLPYHQDFRYTDRDNRYMPYEDIVRESPSTAFITTNFPELDRILRDGLVRSDIEYARTTIGPYSVFYDLSRPVDPEQLGVYQSP